MKILTVHTFVCLPFWRLGGCGWLLACIDHVSFMCIEGLRNHVNQCLDMCFGEVSIRRHQPQFVFNTPEGVNVCEMFQFTLQWPSGYGTSQWYGTLPNYLVNRVMTKMKGRNREIVVPNIDEIILMYDIQDPICFEVCNRKKEVWSPVIKAK